MMPIRVLIVDDHAGFRQRLTRLLSLQDDLRVVGEAADGVEAIARARDLQPDVVLMDFRMSRLDGLTAARSILEEQPHVRVLILTAYPGALDADQVARNGLAGLLLKDRPAEEIVTAIRKSVA